MEQSPKTEHSGEKWSGGDRFVTTMDLSDVTMVGQDVGGMIAYSYLRTYDDLAAAVITDVVLPGVDPWEEVLRNRS